MNTNYILIGSLLLFFFTLGMLYRANIKREKRYLQLPLPFFAFIFSMIFILLDDFIIKIFEQTIFTSYPFVEPYVFLLLNFSFMITFLILKWCWRVGQFLFKKKERWFEGILKSFFSFTLYFLREDTRRSWRKKLFEDDTVSLIYQTHRGRIYIQNEWIYLSNAFRIVTCVVFLLVMTQMVSGIFSWNIYQYFPQYSIVSLVILFEIAWFIGGDKMPTQSGLIDGNDAHAKKQANYDSLFKIYEELWGQRILTKGIIKTQGEVNNRHYMYKDVSKAPEIEDLVSYICERLKKEKIILNDSYIKVLTNLLEEKDLLIEDVLYNDLSPYFFSGLFPLLSKNKKMLVITQNQSASHEAINWFQKGLDKVSGINQLCKVSHFNEALEQNSNPDLLIITPEQLQKKGFLQYLQQFEKNESISGIILLQAEKIIASHSLLLQNLHENIIKQLHAKPQYIVFSEWYEGLEHTVRQLFHCEPIDVLATAKKQQKLHYIIWKREDDTWFQQRILSKISHRKLEDEVVLSLPAIESGIEPIRFVQQDKSNARDSIRELIDLKETLYEYGYTAESIDYLHNLIIIHHQNLTIPVEDYSFLFIRDANNNLVQSFHQWKNTGEIAAFLHILSPPYLLRDYLASQFEFFQENKRRIAPFVPRYSDTQWNTAFYLLEQLSQGYVDEEVIVSYLSKAKLYSFKSVVDGIHELFTLVFGDQVNYRANIESKIKTVFYREKKEFEDVVLYRFPYALREKIVPHWYKFISITQNGIKISEVFAGHVYQQYLPGQIHSFAGEPYKIQSIDLNRGIVEVSYEPNHEEKMYRQIRKYVVNYATSNEDRLSRKYTYDKYEVTTKMLEVNMEVSVNGYLEFNQFINLKQMKEYSYTETNQEIKRSYRNGNILFFQVRVKEGSIENKQRIAYTLSVLLNEVFLTLFPETYHFITAVAHLPSLFNQEDEITQKLKKVHPTIEIFDNEAEDDSTINLYIIEDSLVHLGVLDSIRENWEHIFDIIHDYLFWVLEENHMNNSYLCFGLDQFPKELALEAAYRLINELITKKKLRDTRLNYFKKEQQDIISKFIYDGKQCTFCGNRIPLSQFYELGDGRKRCFTCHQSAIDKVIDIEPLYKQIRALFKEKYLIDVRTDIVLSVKSTAEIHKLSGFPFIPDGGAPRLSGKAIMVSKEQMKILIENGAPKLHTIATIAHELTHIWQFDHLPVHEISLEELEGLAIWVEIDIMESLGEAPYADMLKNELLKRNDVYGRGYKLMLERLEELPEKVTPFDLYTIEKVQ